MSKTNKIHLNSEEMMNQQTKVDSRLVKTLILALLLVPLIIKMKAIEFISPEISNSLLDTGTKAEIFTYYKYVTLLIITLILVILFIYKILSSDYYIQTSYINSPTLILLGTITLSLIFSEYSYVALHGHFNRHEGTLTYISYLLIFYISSNIKWEIKWVKYIFFALFPIILVNATLGLFNFYGVNLLNSSILQTIISPIGGSEKSVEIGGYISSTFYNPNYLSGIASVLTVLFLALAITEQKRLLSYLYLLFSVISYSMILFSLSSSGFVTLILVLPLIFLFIIFMKRKLKGLLMLIQALVCFVIIFVPLNEHNPKVWDESIGFFISRNIQPEEAVGVGEFLESFLPGKTVFADGSFNEFILPTQGFGPGSGRLYIWEETIELIKDRPLLGYGLDTLPHFFPQNDPDKYSNLASYEIIVDKPHNMYLGLAYGSGIIALFAFVMLIINHFIKSIMFFRKGKEITTEIMVLNFSLFVAWIAYLIQGLFNETFIGTAPIFWILFGISVSLIGSARPKRSQSVET